MNTTLGRLVGWRSVWRCCLVTFAAILFGSLAVWALPEKGTPAPPLQFTQLLQAPPGARADWHALRGKVVVLEFWATWCAPCVAAIPDLNELVSSLDPAKFQFISVDDEAPKVVEGFLARKKMAGWVGIDTTGGVFAWYGIQGRPTTIIVDPEGRIVAAINPEDLDAASLQSVAAGKDVRFPTAISTDMAALKKTAPAPTVKPLFEVYLSKAAPNEQKYWEAVWHTGVEIHGTDAEDLLTYAYRQNKSRLLLENPLPDGLFDLRTEFATEDDSVTAPLLQTAIASGLHLRILRKTVTRSVYVLKASDAARKLLAPTATPGVSMSGFQSGRLSIVNGSMDVLAYSLEDGLEAPVINETGIEGRFDVELEFAPKDVEGAKAALKALGLELVQADRSITVLDVSAVKSMTASAATVKPLFVISLSNAASGEEYRWSGDLTGMNIYGASTENLLSVAFNLQKDRILSASPLPDGHYDLRMERAGADASVYTPILQTAIASGLHLRVQKKIVTRSVYVLKATGAGSKFLAPPDTTGGSTNFGYERGKKGGALGIRNGSMDILAYTLEDGLETPVINETGIDGKFDVELEFAPKDVEGAKAALKALGLELVQADRSITVLEVSKQEESKPSAASNPQPAPKP